MSETGITPVPAGGGGLPGSIEVDELERIEIHLPAAPEGMNWSAGLIVNGEQRPLPAGSTLDEEDRVFYWQLGPGLLGQYQLEFSHAAMAPVKVLLRVLPRPEWPPK